jgi:hypothetical protein
MEYMQKTLLYKVYYTTTAIRIRFMEMNIEDKKILLFRKPVK